jgi:putative transposase
MSNTNTLKINKSNINQDKLRSFAAELAKDVKTQADLADLSSALLKMTVEAALGAEMEHQSRLSKI